MVINDKMLKRPDFRKRAKSDAKPLSKNAAKTAKNVAKKARRLARAKENWENRELNLL